MDVRSAASPRLYHFQAVIGGFAHEFLQMLPQSCGGNLLPGFLLLRVAATTTTVRPP